MYPDCGLTPGFRDLWRIVLHRFIRHIQSVTNAQFIAFAVAALMLGRLCTALWLAELNRRHVRAHAKGVPEPFRGMIDEATYGKAIRYTLAKNRFGQFTDVYDTLVLLFLLYSGVLPVAYAVVARHLGMSPWAMSAFLVWVTMCVRLVELPFDWYAVFRLEQRFGFNTSTLCTWITDRVKEMLLTIVLLYPIGVVLLEFFDPWRKFGWLWVWLVLLCIQVTIVVIAPVLILPLFNKFTPLPEGELRERVLALARRAGFHVRKIEVMDGSRRSRHSNAFFTGLGPFRKIVLFDTLIEQLSPPELEAVLAHEIGHFKLKHVPIRLALSAGGLLVGLWAMSVVTRAASFYRAFGFEPGHVAPVLLLFGLLAGTVVFWLTPLMNWLSRMQEHAADKFASKILGEPGLLISALLKLEEKNLSNLTPHPIFSRFYYSHPTLLERKRALQIEPT